MKNVKITVLKTLFFAELAEQYLEDGRAAGPCPLQREGQVFLYRGGAEKPEGLCPWAWIDIYRGVNALSAGADYRPWNKHGGQQVLCCTDGVRPVVYLVEATDADSQHQI